MHVYVKKTNTVNTNTNPNTKNYIGSTIDNAN